MLFLIAWYLWLLTQWPLPVKALTSAVLAGLSDAVVQRMLGVHRLSLRRCCLLGLFGLAWYGPSNHAWQALLVRLFPPVAYPPGTSRASLLPSLLRVAQRVGLDQLLYAPLNNALMILYVSLVADRRGWPAARQQVVSQLPAVQRRGWRVWPLVQLVNQSVVPLELRVLVNNIGSLLWTSFVIMRARSATRSNSRKLPVFNVQTGSFTDLKAS